MITEFLFLLCLGLCLGNEDEENNGNQEESKPTPAKTDTRIIFVATFSCLSLFLLFLAIFFIYRCTQQDSSEEESIKSCHSKVHKQRDADVSRLERISESPDEPEGVTYAQLNTAALSGAASVPAEETPNSCDYTMVKV
ncbi:PREDICTED: V-set and transmembrane domain-containing protein 1 isoform X2 [Bison bison bison]|uniref:V-set and transmembrane domain-containing protein 1 isoform X2 n=1 Tax=Bison bison bison TaxID=43346 RepID=A0A6P3IIR8_BISBB|nr:PREDICTED: V-set and transmembrane domain-containing protein 1 isoform X2 [Bison bison bison]